jgi:hypothetical protein
VWVPTRSFHPFSDLRGHKNRAHPSNYELLWSVGWRDSDEERWVTTRFERKTKCGETTTFTVIGSTNAFGSCDLDTRPPEMMRSTIAYHVQRCPACGYCSPDITEAPEGIGELLARPVYRERLYDPAYLTTVNDFRCWSLIARVLGYYDQAAWAAIHAAWVCDDRGEEDAAVVRRLLAVDLSDEARAHGQGLASDNGTEPAIRADLLRGAGQFQEALNTVEVGLSQDPGELVRAVLLFEQELVGRFDTACYTVEEAMDGWTPTPLQT